MAAKGSTSHSAVLESHQSPGDRLWPRTWSGSGRGPWEISPLFFDLQSENLLGLKTRPNLAVRARQASRTPPPPSLPRGLQFSQG